MLGEKIGEEQSKTMSQRVLNVQGATSLETCGQGHGTIYGVDYRSTVTYVGTLRPDGTIAGEGKGVLMGKGGEHATLTGNGVGRFTKDGGVSWRGNFLISSQHPKWSKLNNICTLFEYEIDADGQGKGTFHEWR